MATVYDQTGYNRRAAYDSLLERIGATKVDTDPLRRNVGQAQNTNAALLEKLLGKGAGGAVGRSNEARNISSDANQGIAGLDDNARYQLFNLLKQAGGQQDRSNLAWQQQGAQRFLSERDLQLAQEQAEAKAEAEKTSGFMSLLAAAAKIGLKLALPGSGTAADIVPGGN